VTSSLPAPTPAHVTLNATDPSAVPRCPTHSPPSCSLCEITPACDRTATSNGQRATRCSISCGTCCSDEATRHQSRARSSARPCPTQHSDRESTSAGRPVGRAVTGSPTPNRSSSTAARTRSPRWSTPTKRPGALGLLDRPRALLSALTSPHRPRLWSALLLSRHIGNPRASDKVVAPATPEVRDGVRAPFPRTAAPGRVTRTATVAGCCTCA
jgi:hypothetical protein